MRSEIVGQRVVPDSGEDPRVATLRRAVERLRRDLAGHPAKLDDRRAAEEELAALDAMTRHMVPEVSRLRTSLLLVVATLGSVSALAGPVSDVCKAIELFGEPAR